MTSSKAHKYITAVGRRKQAVARVRLFKGKEAILINGRPASAYFPGNIMGKILMNPLKLVELVDRYTATVKATGSGKMGQLEAVVHALARALVKLDVKYKTPLRSAGLLTRDPRKRQRRMVGTGGKARRRKQSPKR